MEGCILFVLFLVAFYGDAVLVISLLTADASFLTYEGNLLFVIISLVVDIYFIYLITQSVRKSREQQRIVAENNRIADDMCILYVCITIKP